MRLFNDLKGEYYDELISAYEQYLPGYFGKLSEAFRTYPEALENEEYNLYVDYNKWPIRKLEYSYVISKMKKIISKGAKVLDAGCGVSSMPFLLTQFGGDVTAVDFDKKSIALMERFSQDSFFGEGGIIKTKVCDIMQLPFEDNYFDVVMSVSVLEHLPYPNYLLAISELYRVLKTGGTLICTCDISAVQQSKRRAVGAFSTQDIKKILAEFKGELVEEELDLEDLTITEEEVERFWAQHYYDGIGYEGNRGYVAVGFQIKKKLIEDKKLKLLKYDDMIKELISYETLISERQQELEKVNRYALDQQLEKEKLLQDLIKINNESEQRLAELIKVSEESEKRLEAINYLKSQIGVVDKIIRGLWKE